MKQVRQYPNTKSNPAKPATPVIASGVREPPAPRSGCRGPRPVAPAETRTDSLLPPVAKGDAVADRDGPAAVFSAVDTMECMITVLEHTRAKQKHVGIDTAILDIQIARARGARAAFVRGDFQGAALTIRELEPYKCDDGPGPSNWLG